MLRLKIKKFKPKVVVPVFLTSDFESLFQKIKSAKKEGADIIELRADSWPKIEEKDLVKIKKILKKIKIPAIFTVREKEEGGRKKISLKRKLGLIKKAIQLGFEFVDVELKFLEKAKIDISELKRDSKTKIILSYHNFKNIKINALQKIKEKMLKLKPDILKIAIFSKNPTIGQAILKLIKQMRRKRKKFVGIVMDKEARVKCLLAGSYWDYFCLNEREKTAPGQITLNELKYLMKNDC